MVDVFVVDDHEVVRRGLRDLLDEIPDLTFVGEADTCAASRPSIRMSSSSTSGCPTATATSCAGTC